MSFKSDAEEFYAEHYRGQGIAPKHVVALKAVLAKAARKGAPMAKAAKAFFKEKGITVAKTEEKEDEAPKKTTKAAEKAKPKEKTPVEAAPVMQPAKLDRASLKGTLIELDRAGVSNCKVMKSDSDDDLRLKVHKALESLATPESVELLTKLQPNDLRAVNADCLGIFVDLRSASCAVCTTKTDCVKKYLQNLGNGFKSFEKIVSNARTEEAAKAVSDDDAKAVTKTREVPEKKMKVQRITYDPKRMIIIRDEPNPNEKGDDAYEFVEKVLAEGSMTMKEMRAIAEEFFEIKSDQQFADQFVVGLRETGLACFPEELTEEEVAGLDDEQKAALGLPVTKKEKVKPKSK